MKTVMSAALAAVLIGFGSGAIGAADRAKLRHLASVYMDEKSAGLKQPEAVACDGKGRLIVGDTGNDRLLKFAFRDGTLSGGSEIKVPELSAPTRVHLNAKGDIFVLDGRRRRIVRLSPDGAFGSAIALDGAPPPATTMLRSFTLDAAGTVYALDEFAARVLVVDDSGRFQRAVPLPDTAGFVSDLTVDQAGTILVIDSVRRRLFSAAKDAAAFEPLGGDLADAVTTMPTAIATAAGLIFVVEGAGSSIVTLARDGTFLGRQLTAGWAEGALNHPAQLCVNDKGEVFVADRDNARIQVFGLIR